MPSSLQDLLKGRASYLSSATDPIGDRPDGGRWMVINVWKMNDYKIPEDQDAEPLLFYADFIFQQTNKMDRERVQVIPNSEDSGKSYFFDREPRIYTFQGFVYDIPHDAAQRQAGLVADGFTTFKTLYNTKFRMSEATRQKLIVELDCDDFRLWGTMTNMVATHSSDNPTMFVITFAFWVEAMDIKPNFGSYGNIFLSLESAKKIGLTELGDLHTVVPVKETSAFVAGQTTGVQKKLIDSRRYKDPLTVDSVTVVITVPPM